jgi:hypothetical protein
MINNFCIIPLIFIALEPSREILNNSCKAYENMLSSSIEGSVRNSKSQYSDQIRPTTVENPNENKGIFGISFGMGYQEKNWSNSNYLNNAYQFGVLFGIGSRGKRFGLELTYSNHNFDDDKFRANFGSSPHLIDEIYLERLTVMPVGHFALIESETIPSFYFSFGAGLLLQVTNFYPSKYSLESEIVPITKDVGYAFRIGWGIDIVSGNDISMSFEINFLNTNTSIGSTNMIALKLAHYYYNL